MTSEKKAKRIFTTCEAARLLELRPFRLRAMQQDGTGPEFTGSGKCIRYAPETLKKWIIETGCVSLTRRFI